jgi:hypothetical protein
MSLIEFDGPVAPTFILFVVNLLSYYFHLPVGLRFGPFRKGVGGQPFPSHPPQP